MSQTIHVHPAGPHEWTVDVHEGDTTTHHKVTVPEDLLADYGVAGADEQQVVTQTFHFLLEQEPATSIYEEFPLDVVADRFPSYPDDLRSRLGGAA